MVSDSLVDASHFSPSHCPKMAYSRAGIHLPRHMFAAALAGQSAESCWIPGGRICRRYLLWIKNCRSVIRLHFRPCLVSSPKLEFSTQQVERSPTAGSPPGQALCSARSFGVFRFRELSPSDDCEAVAAP